MVEKEDSSWDQLVASLDPPIADRISSVFPDADPKVLQTVSTLFTEQLTGYMLDFLDGTEPLEVSKIPLFPLLLEKTVPQFYTITYNINYKYCIEQHKLDQTQ